jgi:SSS family solute:Na+ symporter
MPYIALQLIGMQVVIAALGFGGGSVPGASSLASQLPWLDAILKDLPLIIAFLILAFYTYTSGLRAPARSFMQRSKRLTPKAAPPG